MWAYLAELVGIHPTVLRTECISAGYAGAGFFERRVLNVARGRPWSLGHGDVEANLTALVAEDAPSCDETTWKIWKLLRRGTSILLIKRGIEHLFEANWHTLAAEQAHGSAAMLKRMHPEYALETLVGRSAVLMINRLQPSLNPIEKRIQRLQEHLARLERKMPQRGAATHMWTKEVFDSVKYLGLKWNFKTTVSKLMARAGQVWLRQPPEAKAVFALRAAVWKANKETEIAEDKEGVMHELALCQAQLDAERRVRPPILFSTCQWGPQEHGCFQRLYESKEYAGVEMVVRRQQTLEPPFRDEAFLVRVKRQARWPIPEPPEPPWLKAVCKQRSHLQSCGFRFELPGLQGQYVYKFLFAVQSPEYAGFLQLEPVEQPVPCLVGGESLDDLAGAFMDLKYKVSRRQHFSATALPAIPPEEITVLRPLIAVNEDEYVVLGPVMNLKDYLELLPEVTRKAPGAKKRGRKPKAPDDAPGWVKDRLAGKKQATHGGHRALLPVVGGIGPDDDGPDGPDESSEASGDDGGGAAARGPDADDEPNDSDVERVFRELERRRGEYEDLYGPAPDDFRVLLVAGAEFEDPAADAVSAFRGEARTEETKDFARAQGVHMSGTFFTSRYGSSHAGILARGWCHKMQYFFNIAVLRGNDCHFTSAEVEAYEEPTEFSNLAREVSARSPEMKRIRDIRALFPRAAAQPNNME